MPRGLSTEIKAAIAADTVRPVYLAYFNFDGGAIRTWTGDGDLSYDSETWSSNAVVTGWPTVTESVDLVANNITLTLSGNYDYAVDIANPAVYRARTCEVYIGFLDEDGSLPASNVYKLFSGRMSVVSFVEDGETDAYSLTVESRLVDLQNTKVWRYTHQAQLQRFAGDMGLEYAANAQASLFLSRGETADEPFSRKIIYGETKIEGSIVFIATSGSGSRYLNLVVAFADHECESIEQLYLDDRTVLTSGVVSGEWVDVVDYHPHLGTDAQTVDTDLQTEVGSTVWTANHRLRGICYVYLRILYSEELFGTEAPSVSARIKGKKLYDPRTATTAYSANAALAVRDYLLSERYGFSGGSTEVDDSAFSVAANDCDYMVARADGGTEARYTVNGALDTADTIGTNLSQLLTAMAGKVSYIGGVFALYAGSYSLTSLQIADAELVDDLAFSNRNLRDAYNSASGLYRTAALGWQEEDYPVYQNAAALAADGEARWIDLSLPLTTSAARCQRIAKIAVMRSRAARSVSLSAMLAKLEIRAGDVISLNTAKSQIGTAVYEVRSLSIALGLSPEIGFELLEVAASDYAWDAATEESELTVAEEPADSILAWTLARLASPSASPGSKTFTVGFNVTVSHNESDVTVYYTTDGSEPTESDSSIADGGTIAIGTATTTLKLKSFQNTGSLTSEVVTYEYDYEAPSDYVPEPDYRWTWYYAALSASDNYPRLQYSISGLSGCKLYNSENGGSSWSTLQASTSDGSYYTDATEITSSWTPSDYRAYGEKAGYLDSNALIVDDKCIAPCVWSQDSSGSSDYVAAQVFGTNCTLWRRYATKQKSGGVWGGWSSWSKSNSSGLSWAEYIGTSFPLLVLESTSVWYSWEFYVEQSGFSDSDVIFVDGEDRTVKYGGESGGVSIGSLPHKTSTYS
jgi:hypothetical protein